MTPKRLAEIRGRLKYATYGNIMGAVVWSEIPDLLTACEAQANELAKAQEEVRQLMAVCEALADLKESSK